MLHSTQQLTVVDWVKGNGRGANAHTVIKNYLCFADFIHVVIEENNFLENV